MTITYFISAVVVVLATTAVITIQNLFQFN